MITSPTKHEHLQAYSDFIGIIEIATNCYKNNPSPQLLQAIQELEESRIRLKEYIDTHDFTAEDTFYLSHNKLST